MALLTGRSYFKPFTYERFFQRWKKHEESRWDPDEVSMASDCNDWEHNLSPAQKDFLTNIFRFFTQGDVEIAGAYYTQFLPIFSKLPEVGMMIGSFAAREATHMVAYATLIESCNMPESTYSDFLNYTEMRNKHDYLESFSSSFHLIGKPVLTYEDKEHLAISIALFSGGVEGIQLFSSFAMLSLFPLNKLMMGMGRIVNWSMADESQHVDGMIDLFKTFVSENPELNMFSLQPKIQKVIGEIVDLEREFIKLIFARYDPAEFFGMTPERIVLFIEYIADHRLVSMGFESIYNTSVSHPIPELAVMINAPALTNFFETTPTDYSLGLASGSWSSVWGNIKTL